jgi:rhodanese-related sulfurtransferase
VNQGPAPVRRNVTVALPAPKRIFSPMPSSESPASSYPLEISVEETRRLLAANPAAVHLIDVREPFEYETAHITGAQLIPMRQIPENVGTLPKDKHLLIHCHHGGRSLRVVQYLRSQGFDAATNVAGGIHAWSQQIDPSVPTY